MHLRCPTAVIAYIAHCCLCICSSAGKQGALHHGLKCAQGVEVMGPQKWKRLVDAASRRYKALMTVLRDPAAAKQKAEAAEAARYARNPHVLCTNACSRR